MMKQLKKVRAGIEMGLNHLIRLGDYEKMYVRKKGGFTFVSDTCISYGDIVDVTVDKENKTVVLRFVDERGQAQAESWFVPVNDQCFCGSLETVVAENGNQKLLVVPTDTTITYPDGVVIYWGKERVYLTPDLAPAWRLLRGK